MIVLIAILLLCTGCETESYQEGGGYYGLSRHHLRGHSYIVCRANNGCAMLHDPDCACFYNQQEHAQTKTYKKNQGENPCY